MSYTGKTGATINKGVFKADPTLHTDGFYIPVWMSTVLKEADRDKSVIVREALREYFEEHDLVDIHEVELK